MKPPKDWGSGVVVSWLHPGETAGQFTDSLVGMLMHDAKNDRRVVGKHGGTISMSSGPRVAEARSQLCERFLADEQFAGAGWLLMLDADMTFEPDLVARLVAVSEQADADVVGGLCFAGGRQRVYPTLYRLDRDEHGEVIVESVPEYPRDGLVKVGATGAACILIRRRTLIAMLQPHPKGFGTLPTGAPNSYPWFVEGHVMANGRPLGEDIAFCMRVNAMGGTIFVDTSIKLGHVKSFVMDEPFYEETVARQHGQVVAVDGSDGRSTLVVGQVQEDDERAGVGG